MVLYYTESFIITCPSSHYDLNDVEWDVKYKNHHLIVLFVPILRLNMVYVTIALDKRG